MLNRLHFVYEFPELDTCSARTFASRLCILYQGKNCAYLKAIGLSLSTNQMFPDQAFSLAGILGVGLRSIIHLATWVEDADGPVYGFGCGRDPVPNDKEGVLQNIPQCPVGAVKCSDKPELCSEDNSEYDCVCGNGYIGALKLLLPDEAVKEKHFGYSGQCMPIDDFCDANKHVLEDGQPATGHIGELAFPNCSRGFVAAGRVKCAEDTAEHGIWRPSRGCDFIMPNAPPTPFCQEPNDTALIAIGCGSCPAIAGREDTKCKCDVSCAKNHGLASGKAGKKGVPPEGIPLPTIRPNVE